MCGVIGLYEHEPVIGRMYSAMLTLQHRGQDAAGILTYDGTYHLKKGNGLIRDIFDERNISRLTGKITIGHTRYPTVGGGGKEDAQPFYIHQPYGMAGAHNGNVTNFFQLKKELFERSNILVNSNCDGEAILHVFAEYMARKREEPVTPQLIFQAVRYVHRRVRGSYSAVIHIAEKGMVAFRDPHGLRQLVFGQRTDAQGRRDYGFASESVSLEVIGYQTLRDLPPGGAFFIDAQRNLHEQRVTVKPFRPCIFEYIYFARPDTIMNGINVYQSRVLLGRKLARQIRQRNLDIDLVVPVPDSARSAAIEIARVLKKKYREGLVKNRYIGRTFIMPGQEIRKQSVRQKLNPITSVLKGQKVLLVDDSIVRGTTSRSLIEMVREAGAEKVYFASFSAPLRHPCVYGIDMQTRGEFIATDADAEEIARRLGADGVIYQDMHEMEEAVRQQNRNIKSFCKACFTGHYPTGDVSEETLSAIESERDAQKQAAKDRS